jgi:hypothetical protein
VRTFLTVTMNRSLSLRSGWVNTARRSSCSRPTGAGPFAVRSFDAAVTLTLNWDAPPRQARSPNARRTIDGE